MHDPHSHARPDEARVTHVDLALRADFDARVLEGTATLTVRAAPGATHLTLDARDLVIDDAADSAGRSLPFAAGTPDPLLGPGVRIALPADRSTVVIRYRTSPDAAALQWLEPAPTAGPCWSSRTPSSPISSG